MDKKIDAIMERVIAMVKKETGQILEMAITEIKDNKKNSFETTEKMIRDSVLKIGASILEGALEAVGNGYTKSIIPCSCGKKMRYVEDRPKKILTLTGEVKISRAYYNDGECNRGLVPLDKRLDIENTTFSPGVREAIALIDAEIPFEKGRIILKKIMHLEVSKQRSIIISEAIGKEIERRSIQDQNNLKQKEIKIEEVPSRLYVSADGTMVLTDQKWKEVKVGAIFDSSLDNKGNPVRGQTNYVGSFEDSEKFGWRLWSEAYKRGSENAKEIIGLGDGSKWIWNLIQFHFPGSVEIVDWYHATERVWGIAKFIYGEGSPPSKKWAKKQIKFLKKGKINNIISSIKEINPKGKEKKEKVQDAITYFENNQGRMNYKYFRRKGYFIGSGVVEAGCKHIVGDRFKKSGMRWSMDGAQSILQLKLCVLNDKWDHFWANHMEVCRN